MEIKIEQLEPLEYLAKLEGTSVEKLVHKVLDAWLTDNFSEVSLRGEIKHGLLHVSECRDSRGRLLQRRAQSTMRENINELRLQVLRAIGWPEAIKAA